MPDCSQIALMLSAYLDRDLPPETCAGMDAHLQSCSRCENAATELRRTIALCREFRAQDLPGPIAEDSRQQLRAAFEKALESMQHRPGV